MLECNAAITWCCFVVLALPIVCRGRDLLQFLDRFAETVCHLLGLWGSPLGVIRCL